MPRKRHTDYRTQLIVLTGKNKLDHLLPCSTMVNLIVMNSGCMARLDTLDSKMAASSRHYACKKLSQNANTAKPVMILT